MSAGSGGPAPIAGPLFLRWLKAVLRGIDRVSYGGVVACMMAMAGLVAAQVFFRYVLSSSIDSADELSRLFFVWSMFLAIPHGIKVGIHVGIDIVVRQFTDRLQDIAFRAMSGASAILMVLVFYTAIFVVADKWQDLMPTIDITAAVYYIAVLICAGHSCLHLVVLMLGGARVWEDAAA